MKLTKTMPMAEQNDYIRSLLGRGEDPRFRTGMTPGVQGLIKSEQDFIDLVNLVINFDDFNEDNDPYGEHDFFIFEFKGHSLNFKIDYYDSDVEMGSDDPTDPDQTVRVMMLMLASEY